MHANYNEDATLDDGDCQYTVLTFSVNENIGGTILINGVEYSDFPSNIIVYRFNKY